MTAGIIDQPGVYDIPEADYHADPVPGGSLSASGAKLLLPPSCPALFRHAASNPKVSAAFDFGSAAHKLVLGKGPELHAVDAADWRTNAAKDERDQAREAGLIPLLARDYERAEEMAAVVRAHPIAGPLFSGQGLAEQSLFWTDPDTGVWRRARLDWIKGRIVADYKTCISADPAAISRHVYEYRYHQQDAQYTDAVEAVLNPPGGAEMTFIFQMKTAPYLITVVVLDEPAVAAGRALNRRAMEIYRDCTEADIWPAHADDIEYISLPRWAAPAEEYA